MSETVADKLDRIAAEFTELEPRERLELLLEFAEKLTPLPAAYQAERDAGLHRVHECQTPVFVWTEVKNGIVRIWADVAAEAPTVKGFVSILVEVLSDASAAEVLTMDANFVQRLGLGEALGMLRTRGLSAVLYYIRQRVREATTPT